MGVKIAACAVVKRAAVAFLAIPSTAPNAGVLANGAFGPIAAGFAPMFYA